MAEFDRAAVDGALALTERHGALEQFWIAVGIGTYPMVLRVILVLVGVAYAWRRRWDLASFFVLVPMIEFILAPLSKSLAKRPRPHSIEIEPILVESGYSYPSGHAAAAAMFTLAVVLLVVVEVDSTLLRQGAAWTAALIGALSCFDRLFLGVHYLSDVVAGALLGIVITLAGWMTALHFGASRFRRLSDGADAYRGA